MKQEDLPTFLKVAQMLQIKGLEDGEEQIPLLNDYVNVLDPHDLKDVTAASNVPSKQENKNKTLDESVHSYSIPKKNSRTQKKHVTEDNYNSIKKLKNESNVHSKDDIYFLSNNDEKYVMKNVNNFSKKDIRHNKTNETINDSEEIIELCNEESLEENSLLQSGTFYYVFVNLLVAKYLY